MALLTKHEAAQLIAQLFDLFRLTGCTKAFGQFEKSLFFLLTSFDSLLDEVY